MDPPVHMVAETGSTNDDIHRAAEDGAPDGTVVVASSMSAGRGSRGRTWHAPLGGLWMTVLRRPSVPAATGVLSLRVGLAVAQLLEQSIAVPVALKWPNDVMLDDRKLGGVLCEMRWHGPEPGWVAIGVGLNVTNPLPDALRQRATNMARYAPDITVADLTQPFVETLRAMDVERDTLDASELEAFATRNWLRSKTVATPVQGKVLGVDRQGALEVETAEGVQTLHSAHLTVV